VEGATWWPIYVVRVVSSVTTSRPGSMVFFPSNKEARAHKVSRGCQGPVRVLGECVGHFAVDGWRPFFLMAVCLMVGLWSYQWSCQSGLCIK